jgi:succinyl-CoA synthetase beta subunit
MPRKRLSEFRAKALLYRALDQHYIGWEVDSQNSNWRNQIEELKNGQKYVVKVDQAEKGRFKKGLVMLDRSKKTVAGDIEKLFAKGYRFVLVEPFSAHAQKEERYFSIDRTRSGNQIYFSKTGGVDVEEQASTVKSFSYGSKTPAEIDIPQQLIDSLIYCFDANYFSFLEINPLLIQDSHLMPLDAAVEVDSEALFFEDGWTESDVREPHARQQTAEELTVRELANNSQASFSLQVINPNGSIFLLLSGGGASVVVADEVHNLGYGSELANYGEYSGNPSFEETRLYTEQVVKLLLASNAPIKTLIIGGGVANFTDIRVTFKGIIAGLKALEKLPKSKQAIKVFVRRGGPYQAEGLAAIRSYLRGLGIAGTIVGPELLLSDIVSLATKGTV